MSVIKCLPRGYETPEACVKSYDSQMTDACNRLRIYMDDLWIHVVNFNHEVEKLDRDQYMDEFKRHRSNLKYILDKVDYAFNGFKEAEEYKRANLDLILEQQQQQALRKTRTVKAKLKQAKGSKKRKAA